MSSGQPLEALLLAAGASRRFGTSKQLAPLDGEALVRRCAQEAIACGLRATVVLGNSAPQIEACLHDLPLRCRVHAGWADGIGSSIAFGMRCINETRAPAAVLVLLADQALVTQEDLKTLVMEHQRSPRHLIAARYSGTVGVPCVFPKRYFVELLALSGDQGAKSILSANADQLIAVDLPNAAMDIDTAEDLRRAESCLRRSS